MTKRRWTEAELDHAWLLRSMGNSDAAIGEKIGRSESAVRWQLRYGVPPASRERVKFPNGELVVSVSSLNKPRAKVERLEAPPRACKSEGVKPNGSETTRGIPLVQAFPEQA